MTGANTNTAILKVDRLTRYFGGLAAVKDVSFEVQALQIFGIIGPNGAGKTTLFSMIAGGLKSSEGKIVALGQETTGQPSHRLVKIGIARTHQIVRPFRALTVLENVQIGVYFGRKHTNNAAVARDSALEVLRSVGIDSLAYQPASILSVGQQKRLEIARALATQPELLLCDEICGGLTHSETAAMLQLLRKIRDNGTTVMYVEHDVKAITSVCDRIMVLNYGRRLAEGTPEEIQRDPVVIEAYLGARATGGKQ